MNNDNDDGNIIDLSGPQAIARWCKEFSCTEDELIEAYNLADPKSVENVRMVVGAVLLRKRNDLRGLNVRKPKPRRDLDDPSP
ncbi:DUF3606 domain-containing protein [uncultured Pseudomonas sp.]|uniref:DUF3606 domain-containing protein n=1 Tax=uncultured Pseudomonas sp. TaxID=114707 RepID=UPI0025FAC857|nr:DUF3606 domain-containing protein [uncultured Pseudomonas sp.]